MGEGEGVFCHFKWGLCVHVCVCVSVLECVFFCVCVSAAALYPFLPLLPDNKIFYFIS